MEVTKYTLTITLEAFDMASIETLLEGVTAQLKTECYTGQKQFNDGDYMDWRLDKEDMNL